MSQNYKETLNLPRTEFPMKANLASTGPGMPQVLEATRLFGPNPKVKESRTMVAPDEWPAFAQRHGSLGPRANQDRDDTSVYVKFPIVSGELAGKASIVIWTTTPWTLPANLAVAVDPKEVYVVQEFQNVGETPVRLGPSVPRTETLLLAEKLIPQFSANTKLEPVGEPIESFQGSKIDKIKAQHPFFARQSIVLTADFVTMDSGTGAVHIAPGHGEDDYSLGRANKLPILSPVDDHGRLTDEAGLPNLTGKYVFDANIDIVNLLRKRGMLLAAQKFHHSYPYCWR